MNDTTSPQPTRKTSASSTSLAIQVAAISGLARLNYFGQQFQHWVAPAKRKRDDPAMIAKARLKREQRAAKRISAGASSGRES